MEGDLKEAVAELLRKGNHQLLSAMLHALLAYADYPYDWKPVGYVDKTGRFVTVTCPPTLKSKALRQLWGRLVDTDKMLWFLYCMRRQGCEEAIREDWTCSKGISWPPGRWR
jgi:hypothetical protein